MNKENPWVLFLPKSLAIWELATAMNIFTKAVAWEIGERFDRVLMEKGHVDWLMQVQKDHSLAPVSMHDPSFVFEVPRKYEDSLLWQALPPHTKELSWKFWRAKKTRNIWQHEDIKQTVDTFVTGASIIQDLASELDLDVAHYGPDLKNQITQIKRAGGQLLPVDQSAELRSLLEHKEEEVDALRKKLEETQLTAEQLGNQAESLALIETAKEAAEVGAQEAQMLADRLHAELQHERLLKADPADSFEIGQIWPSEVNIGSRLLYLSAHMNDLYDAERLSLLSNEVGPIAELAAHHWLQLVPEGGHVNLTENGHAAIKQGNSYLYLGRLDEVVHGFVKNKPVQTEFAAQAFIFKDGEVVSLHEDDETIPEGLVAILVDSGLALNTDIPIRLTHDSIVAAQIDGQWIQLAKLPA
jgi:hypothetical protein